MPDSSESAAANPHWEFGFDGYRTWTWRKLAADGVPAASLDLPEHTWFPEWSVVVEGQARAAGDGTDDVGVVRATASGDDAIVDETQRLIATDRTVTVVTSDRELARRVTDAGAAVRGTRWLLDQLA